MSEGQAATGAAGRLGSGAGRLARAWRALPHERRLAAVAAIALFLTLFLPWYQRHFFNVIGGRLQPAGDSQTAWAAFSFVEAAILLVSAGVLTLLFNRAEGRAFHVPGGDGGVITAAGLWCCLLVIWRIFDKQGATSHGQYATTYGIEWGIFIALMAAGFLAYAGNRIRAAHAPEPPLPGDVPAPPNTNGTARTRPARRANRPTTPAPRVTRPATPAGASEPRRRPTRARPPLPPDQQLTIPLEERRED